MAKAPEPDDLDLLSAIWILASNDDNPLITYRGLTFRLGLPDNFDVRSIVRSRPELFRLGVLPSRLENWKVQLRDNRNVPGWLKVIEDPAERSKAIERLSANDIFRSQFRTNASSEKSPIEIIRWGLEHLDRLRKAKVEARDASAKKWQMWLVFWVSLLGVISQFAIAFAKSLGWI